MRTAMLSRAIDVIQSTLAIIIGLAALVCFLVTLQPLITALFVIFTTLFALNGDKASKAMCVGGIALYIASWPLLNTWGVWWSISACSIGFGMWFLAFARSFTPVRIV